MTDDDPHPPGAGRKLALALGGLLVLVLAMTGLAVAVGLTMGGRW